MRRISPLLLSAALAASLSSAALLPSCSEREGDDVGDATVELEYMTQPPEPSHGELIESAGAMEPVFKALIASVYAAGGYMPSDPVFVGMTVAAASAYSGGALSEKDIISAAFGGETPAAPEASEAPTLSETVELTDIIANDDGYIAYINVTRDDGTVRDIFTANLALTDGEACPFRVTSLLRMTIGTDQDEE